MKNLIFSIAFLMLFLPVSAQVVERTDVEVDVEGMPVIMMTCLDASKLQTENARRLQTEFCIEGAKIEITSKKASDAVYSNDDGNAFSTKAFRSKVVHFTVSKEGYETVEQDFELTSLSPCLYIYLTKKCEE